jgi:hypothetical protein
MSRARNDYNNRYRYRDRGHSSSYSVSSDMLPLAETLQGMQLQQLQLQRQLTDLQHSVDSLLRTDSLFQQDGRGSFRSRQKSAKSSAQNQAGQPKDTRERLTIKHVTYNNKQTRHDDYTVKQKDQREAQLEKVRQNNITANELAKAAQREFEERRQKRLSQQETALPLSQTLQSSAVYQQYLVDEMKTPAVPSAAMNGNSSNGTNYSQSVLLKKINAYLRLIGGTEVSEKGYCNGISLLWLTMMASNTEMLFYKMVDQIAECRDDELLMNYQTIATFLEWIEPGQYPDKYFGNNCHYADLSTIIGTAQVETTQGKTTKQQLTKILEERAKPGFMMSIHGWGESFVDKTYAGHTVALFNRNGEYHVFNSNYPEGRARVAFKPRLVPEVWHQLFDTTQLKVDDAPQIFVSSADGQQIKQGLTAQLGLFGSPKINSVLPVSHSASQASSFKL